ncbi:histidine phosphatase family protein [Clostridium sardiniense]|uniref:Histidine phosphatase family protein n=1 Tax=Clostridium sardiniense TaxID=29369 RepID=A0ABS7L2Q5_CLOSR|nr:histidine phosphatase family protein [Clostridium sardiniense]MBY0757309.1 histidine phosphatase family protein [Clostridium sardiniense]MDQ0461721.1 putative phosphoglycerate mutase [Clostridium sardiniense]
MTTIYLTRHGQTEWNLEKRLQGHGNSPLTEFGLNRAKELSERIKDIDIDTIYTSPIERAYKTAQIVKGDKYIEVKVHEGLKEMNFGDYEGKITEEVMKENPDWDISAIMRGNLEMRAPNGETLGEVRERVNSAMRDIIKENEGKNILIVAHGITLKAIMTFFNDQEANNEVMEQASLTKVIVDGENFNIEFKNDGSHFTLKEEKQGW